MASQISALNHYRPQIEYGETAGWREVAEFLESSSTLSKIDIIGVLTGLQDAVLHFNSQGRGVNRSKGWVLICRISTIRATRSMRRIVWIGD
jgi:hypothetical protein